MNRVIKNCLTILPFVSGFTLDVAALQLTHIPLPPHMRIVVLNTPYVRGETTWAGFSSSPQGKSLIMNLEHGTETGDQLTSSDALIFSYNFDTGATSFLADRWYPYTNRQTPAPDITTLIPSNILSNNRLRALSVYPKDDIISGFINESKGLADKDLATNGTYFNDDRWHNLPAYNNKQSTVLLMAGKEDDQYLLMSNEVGTSIYDNAPLDLDVYSVNKKEKLTVNFTYDKKKAYYLTAFRDHENPYVFYHNVCNIEPNDYECSTTTSYVDRCEIHPDTKTVDCSSLSERGYLLACPLQTSKGVKNFMILVEDNQVRVKQPFAPDLVFPIEKNFITGASVPYFYPWMVGDQCDGALFRRLGDAVLVLQRDPHTPDIVTGFSTISYSDIYAFVKKLSDEDIGSEYSIASPITRVGDGYEFLVLRADKNPNYTDELINIRMTAEEKIQLFSHAY